MCASGLHEQLLELIDSSIPLYRRFTKQCFQAMWSALTKAGMLHPGSTIRSAHDNICIEMCGSMGLDQTTMPTAGAFTSHQLSDFESFFIWWEENMPMPLPHLLNKTYLLLGQFCVGDRANQDVLIPHMQLFESHIGKIQVRRLLLCLLLHVLMLIL